MNCISKCSSISGFSTSAASSLCAGESWQPIRTREHVAPFYLQPTLGGSDDLRGYRAFRFDDNNSALLQRRILVMGSLSAAWIWLYSSTQARFSTDWQQINFPPPPNTDYGFGFRFNVRNDVFHGTRYRFSCEGFAVYVSSSVTAF